MDFASVALVNAAGWILLQERDEKPVIDPQKWGFPGGGLEPGESPEQAAYRELEEETGVRLTDGLVLFGHYDIHGTTTGHDRFSLFAVRADLVDDDIECHEGRQMVFVEPEQTRRLDLTQSAHLTLPLFLDSDVYEGLTA